MKFYISGTTVKHSTQYFIQANKNLLARGCSDMHASPSEFMDKLFLIYPPTKKCETIVYIPLAKLEFSKTK
jgi:hypothetical protein